MRIDQAKSCAINCHPMACSESIERSYVAQGRKDLRAIGQRQAEKKENGQRIKRRGGKTTLLRLPFKTDKERKVKWISKALYINNHRSGKAARILPPVAVTTPKPHQALYHQDTHIFESTITPGLYWRQPIQLGHHHSHYITVQMQQSHSSSPQSQPKHGF
ncbi:hypothetical protein BDV34DRAFT_186704 [Aspergillus parasiticus]|uniref:Uncharacterized protein n=1 Tax=Aspergillus parasiticus TaxID=5067 RepID=A0A5N6E066_ASPPA|nr:hypothetical protein BDV34DRAFT_186704 [Aspergillus parasiticus]